MSGNYASLTIICSAEKVMAIFENTNPKIIESTFSFP